MKLKFFFSLAMSAMAFVAFAEGDYQDGVDNYNAGRLDVAKAILDRTINEPTTKKDVSYYYLGCIALDENRVADAKTEFEKGIAANPGNGYNYIGLGEIALKNGNKAEAEKQFKLGLATDKKSTALVAAVARAYWNVNPTLYAKEIDKNIAKALKDSKNTEPAVYVLQGDMQAKVDPGEAAGLYEMAITQDDERGKVNREAYVKYANTYFRVNPQYAIEKLKELNEKEPNSALAQRELAEKYYDNDQFGSACLQYEKYMKNPNHFQRDEQRFAGLLFSAKRYDESLAIAKKVLQADPNNGYMHRVLLLNYSAQEKYPEAVEAGKTLFAVPGMKLIPNDYILYGRALSETGDAPAAVSVFEKAIELNPDKPDLMTDLSAVYDRAGQKDKAVSILKQYLDMGNGSLADLRDMAKRYQSLANSQTPGSAEANANYAEALKYIDMAIAKAADGYTSGTLAAMQRVKGQILLAKNQSKPDDATINAYNETIYTLDSDPKNLNDYKHIYGEAYRVIGAYYMVNSNKEQAKQYIQKYLEIYPDDENIRKVVDSL